MLVDILYTHRVRLYLHKKQLLLYTCIHTHTRQPAYDELQVVAGLKVMPTACLLPCRHEFDESSPANHQACVNGGRCKAAFLSRGLSISKQWLLKKTVKAMSLSHFLSNYENVPDRPVSIQDMYTDSVIMVT